VPFTESNDFRLFIERFTSESLDSCIFRRLRKGEDTLWCMETTGKREQRLIALRTRSTSDCFSTLYTSDHHDQLPLYPTFWILSMAPKGQAFPE
jgi:hypothetical protein